MFVSYYFIVHITDVLVVQTRVSKPGPSVLANSCSLLTSRRVGGGALQLLDDVDIQQLKRQKILTNEQQVTDYKASL